MSETGEDVLEFIDDGVPQGPLTPPPISGAWSAPVLFREVAALLLLVLACDVTIYRSTGHAGPGVLFLVAPLLLWLGTVRRKCENSLWLLIPMLVSISVRLLWCGSFLAIVLGFGLLVLFAMSLAGLKPYLTQAVLFTSQLIAAGYRGLHHYFRTLARFSPAILRNQWFAIVLPAVTLFVFATIFVMANPDLVKSFGENITWIVDSIDQWLQQFQFTEILFCACAGWLAIGMLRPIVSPSSETNHHIAVTEIPAKSPYYDAYRNTLAVVIGLFAVYLVFEFQTLWFRKFPDGFHYSGYAHEGAAWLTVALGLATLMLSLIFRGTILTDPRLSRLRTLSWIWSIENLLLAIAVFNRVSIYIGFNGMTRMRVVGMFGVASVVVGFLLVLRKIACNHGFTWLIRRQLWTVAFALFLYAVLPVDSFVNQFNVKRIMAGDPRPSVQISWHPTSDEGFLRLLPLVDCNDVIIKDGIRGMLDEKLFQLETELASERSQSWTAKQIATDRLVAQLRTAKTRWSTDRWWSSTNFSPRHEVIENFRKYAFQWY